MEIRRVFIHSIKRISRVSLSIRSEKFVIFEREKRETKRSFYHKWTCSCLSHCPSSPPIHAAGQPPQPKTYVTTSIIAFESVWSITKIHHENDWDLLCCSSGLDQPKNMSHVCWPTHPFFFLLLQLICATHSTQLCAGMTVGVGPCEGPCEGGGEIPDASCCLKSNPSIGGAGAAFVKETTYLTNPADTDVKDPAGLGYQYVESDVSVGGNTSTFFF